jgi:hypothetical protein
MNDELNGKIFDLVYQVLYDNNLIIVDDKTDEKKKKAKERFLTYGGIIAHTSEMEDLKNELKQQQIKIDLLESKIMSSEKNKH